MTLVLGWMDVAGALVAYLYKCKSLSKTGEQLTSIAGVLGFNLVIGSLQETRLDNLGVSRCPSQLGPALSRLPAAHAPCPHAARARKLIHRRITGLHVDSPLWWVHLQGT